VRFPGKSLEKGTDTAENPECQSAGTILNFKAKSHAKER